ncbi:MAG: ATP-binding protein, partial [Candidatus Poribacteria bacterium]
SVLVIGVVGLTAVTLLVLFNRYTERDMDEKLAHWADVALRTGYLDPRDQATYEPVKEAFGVDLIGSAENGDMLGWTFNASDTLEFTTEDYRRLQALLREAAADPDARRTFTVGGSAYRLVHRQIPWDNRAVIVTFAASLDDVRLAQRRMAYTIAGVAIAGIASVLLIGHGLGKAIATPIRELVEVAGKVASGDLTQSVRVRTEDEVGMLGRAFNDMTLQLRRSQEELLEHERLATAGQMAATFAHEIRNPLSSIKMMLQLAGEQTAEEKTARYVENTLEEIDRLNGIVEEMLDFARPAPLTMAQTRLDETMRDVLELMSANLARHGIEVALVSDPDPVAHADPEALKRAFLNILLNAVQAQPDGGEVGVSIVVEDTVIWVVVEDRGPGFSDEAMASLFRPFHTTKTRGSGLGLATTKGLIERHRGELSVENRPDGGARVSIRMPRGGEGLPT